MQTSSSYTTQLLDALADHMHTVIRFVGIPSKAVHLVNIVQHARLLTPDHVHRAYAVRTHIRI